VSAAQPHSKSNNADALTAARWRSEILTWSDEWPDAGLEMPSGHRRSARRLLRACMGVAEMARADGSLRPAGGSPWSISQLAQAMKLSRDSATDTLEWLEWMGRLSKVQGPLTADGRTADERRLVLANVEQTLSALGNGSNVEQASSTSGIGEPEPVPNKPGAYVEKSPSLCLTNEGPAPNVELNRSTHISSSSSSSSSSLGEPSEVHERPDAPTHVSDALKRWEQLRPTIKAREAQTEASR
jgi:hypothetical protein